MKNVNLRFLNTMLYSYLSLEAVAVMAKNNPAEKQMDVESQGAKLRRH